MATTRLMTVEDLERTKLDDRYELIRGELHRMTPTSLRHGKIAGRITAPLVSHVEAHDLGEVFINDVGFVVARDPDTVLAPDIAFIRADRMPSEEEQERFGRLVPDLVIEVVSPSDRLQDIAEKVTLYLDAGVPLVWVFDPRQRVVTVHRPHHAPEQFGQDATLDGGDVVPGFRLPLAAVFR